MNSRLVVLVLIASVSACKQDVPLGRNHADGGGDAATDVPASPDLGLDGLEPDVIAPSDTVTFPDAIPSSTDAPPAPTDATPDATPTVLGSLSCASCAPGMKICRRRCATSGENIDCDVCYPMDPSFGCNQPGCFPPCQFPHATAAPTCGSDGACALGACDPGWGNCDGDSTNGCEANLLGPGSCGTCGTVCPAGQLCTPAGCQSSCQPPLTMCPDGRCADLSKDPEHCGGCATKCFGHQQCRGGTCQDPPTSPPTPAPCTMCGSTCVDLNTDYYNCGACQNSCSPRSLKAAGENSCQAGKCVRRCGPGFVDCGLDCVALATDRDHCGACGHACATTDLCVGGACVPATSLRLATGLTDPMDLAVDADAVYWSDVGDGTIKRVARNGGPVTTLAENQARPSRIAVDATHVYWTNALGASVMRAPKTGGMPAMVSTAVQPTDLALAGDSVYWVNVLSSGPDYKYELRKAPRSGGPSALVLGCNLAIASPPNPYDPDPSTPTVTFLAKDGASLLLVCPQPNWQFAVARIDPSNGDATQSVRGATLYRGPHMAVSGPSFFHLAGGTSTTLWEFDKTTGKQGSSYPLVSSGSASLWSPGQMVASACGLYWWNAFGFPGGKDALVSYVPYRAPVAIFQGAVEPRRTVVDGGTIFWTEKGAIAKMAVP